MVPYLRLPVPFLLPKRPPNIRFPVSASVFTSAVQRTGRITHVLDALMSHLGRPKFDRLVFWMYLRGSGSDSILDLAFGFLIFKDKPGDFWQDINQTGGFFFEIVVILQAKPELSRSAKEALQSKCRVSGDSPASMDDFGNPGLRYPGFLRKSVCGNVHRFQKILLKYLAGMDIRKSSFSDSRQF